ncbi:Protein CHROMATIN REMODELING 4 [Carex littledalei]|uniref:Protein CHROMATIN REMODELING 4 n=1 Tax=Carex littledalei TaxID=544730 RepID=A0A833R2X6_9POAL|nr:Protein CHROMATIN REMODELING 4 [Carex littledalei]
MVWLIRCLVARHYYECEECNIGGELLCWDSYPRTYHLKCLNPRVEGPRRENGTVQNVLKRNASIKQGLREVKHRSMIVVKRSMSTVLLAEHGKEKMYKLLTNSKDIISKEKLNGSQEMESGKQFLRYTCSPPVQALGIYGGCIRCQEVGQYT